MTDPTPGVDFPFTLWKISNMERTTGDDIIFNVHYSVTQFRDSMRADACGMISLKPPVPVESAIPYADLDEATVVGWCQAELGQERVGAIIDSLNAQIDEMLTPKVAFGLPW